MAASEGSSRGAEVSPHPGHQVSPLLAGLGGAQTRRAGELQAGSSAGGPWPGLAPRSAQWMRGLSKAAEELGPSQEARRPWRNWQGGVRPQGDRRVQGSPAKTAVSRRSGHFRCPDCGQLHQCGPSPQGRRSWKAGPLVVTLPWAMAETSGPQTRPPCWKDARSHPGVLAGVSPPAPLFGWRLGTGSDGATQLPGPDVSAPHLIWDPRQTTCVRLERVGTGRGLWPESPHWAGQSGVI